MTRTLWLHCGSFKSGTTSIQNLAWQHRELLLRNGCLYPATGLIADEPDVGIRHSALVYVHQEPEAWRVMVDELVEEIRSSPAREVLLSSEAWGRPGKGEALADLVALLRRAGVVDEVHAVLYLRNRYAYARSFYRQMTRKRDNVLPLAEFVESTTRRLDFLDMVRTIREAVAPGDLRVVSYDRVGNTVEHFFGILGHELPPEPRRHNPGLDAPEIEALRQVNVLAPELREQWPGLAAALPAGVELPLEGTAERLAPGQLDPDPEWRAAFAAESGWSDEEVEGLLARPDGTERDVTELAGILRGVVQAWLDRDCDPTVELTIHPHPLVDDLVVDLPDAGQGRFRITGSLLLAPGASGWLLAVADDDTVVKQGRPSPALEKVHPDRPEAAQAGFAVPRQGFGAHGRIDLVLEQASGERCVLATLRRRWVHHPR